MRRVLQNLIIAFTVIFLFTGMFLYRKSEYVEAGRQIIFRESAWMKEKMRLENVQVKFNGAETVTIGAMQSGEKRVIEIPEEAKPAVTVQVSGTSDLAGKFAGHFSGRITDGTEAMIYLEEDMTLEVSSNMIDD
jgi:hypothetical protein